MAASVASWFSSGAMWAGVGMTTELRPRDLRGHPLRLVGRDDHVVNPATTSVGTAIDARILVRSGRPASPRRVPATARAGVRAMGS